MEDQLQSKIDAYLDEHWEEILSDLESLVCIKSVEDLGGAAEGAPYGPGPRQALDQALAIADRLGLSTHDCAGHIAFADLPGKSDTQIGIIGHVDVVPAGPGWSFEPYTVTRKDGYLLGRGVIDDKGPILTALHAVAFWHDQHKQLPYTIRVLFGANEETNMKDVEYYRAHYADPAFLFTPDAEFPVCYGEAGICSGTLRSAPITDGKLIDVQGGVAVNAVPGEATAVLAAPDSTLRPTPCVDIVREGTNARILAKGKSAHASTPHLGESALDILAEYLLENDAVSPQEAGFLTLLRKVTSCHDGSKIGVAARDEHFGDLTAVGGILRLAGGRLEMSIDFRYPTTTSAAEIERQVNAVAESFGAAFSMEHDKAPFLMDPNSAAVQALLAAYNEATGEEAEPFTMKGGTYARVFSTGVSFGPEKPWEGKPSWVGGMHGPDEGVSEELLKQAFAIYVRTIGRLMQLSL